MDERDAVPDADDGAAEDEDDGEDLFDQNLEE